ncbi:O-antigen ligase family protein [Sphingomicrobium clamense]|uniref:O-antigen ligase family protein n=1 Tax=Sphingomicrobium clamense TaxID=2851013 RepID=A0ABS6V830_9SPHN|nr:O-antigen ligase family protein [Sphingomicrobium sp. B8]MBW0145282.1 O-antigen ligase family protein [Sphingomicrobium sp. B8]
MQQRGAPGEYLSPVLLLFALVLGGGSTLGLANDGWLSAIAIVPVAALIAAHFTGLRPLQREAWWLIALVSGVLALAFVQANWSSSGLWWSDTSRASVANALTQAGVAVNGPLSLTPSDTRIFSLRWLFPLAMLLAIAGAGISERKRTVALIAILGVVAAGLSVVQAFEPALLPYRSTTGTGAGWFANSNHHGLFLACGTAALVLLLPRRAHTEHRYPKTFEQLRPLMIGAGAILLMGMAVLMTGSRAALPLFLVALALAFLARPRNRERPIGWLLALIALPVTLILALLLPRYFEAAFVGPALEDDPRWNALPTILEAASDALPWGTGFGSFERYYLTVEPFDLIGGSSLNEAHNELAQWWLEGGVAGLVLLLAFLVLLITKGWKRLRDGEAVDKRAIRVGAMMFLLIAVHSLIDYPARTVAMGSLAMAAATLWIVPPVNSERRTSKLSLPVMAVTAIIAAILVPLLHEPFAERGMAEGVATRDGHVLAQQALNEALDPARTSTAGDTARRALVSSPLEVKAFEALALVEEGAKSDALIDAGLSLSRRSGILPVLKFQRALADSEFAAAADEALLLMRRGEDDANFLRAVRLAALEPAFAKGLGAQLDPEAYWITPAFDVDPDGYPIEADGASRLLQSLPRMEGGPPPHLVGSTLEQLSKSERPEEAVNLYRALYPDRDPLLGAPYPNARAMRDNTLFDWRIWTPPGMRVSHDLGMSHMDLRGNGLADGPFAWRYLALEPGHHRIGVTMTSSGSRLPVMPDVICIGGSQVARLDHAGRQRYQLDVLVDDGCPLAVLRLSARAQPRPFRQTIRDWTHERLPPR